jgi:cyanophycin synthetase
MAPWSETPRPVGEAIVATMFAEGETGRTPIVGVTGTNGKTTVTRLIAHILRGSGLRVGMTCTDGLYVDGRRIEARDCSGPQSARAVLLNPAVEAAVLETARGGILREGLGFDRCDVAVVTNIGEGDHLGLRGIETTEQLARVKRVLVEAVAPGGAAVLNAADPLVAAMAEGCPGAVIWFARDGDRPRIARHRDTGGRAAFVRGGAIVLAEGGREERLADLADVPMTHAGRAGFQVENALAGAAAAWALGLDRAAIRAGLASFTGDPAQVPGRFNVLHARGATVIIDYAHNPSALDALIDAAGNFAHERRTLVYSACDRRDEDVVRQGEVLGGRFDRILLYRDEGNAVRRDGELNLLLRRGLTASGGAPEVLEVRGEPFAIEWALSDLRTGDLVIIGATSIEETLALVRDHLGGLAQLAVSGR